MSMPSIRFPRLGLLFLLHLYPRLFCNSSTLSPFAIYYMGHNEYEDFIARSSVISAIESKQLVLVPVAGYVAARPVPLRW